MPADLFRETSSRVRLPPALIEKDFWVCWTLKQLFGIEAFRDNILFKGGTSLSKIFNAIHRFSEDIDLAINFEMLGFTGPRHPSAAPSRNKRQKILDEMLIACPTTWQVNSCGCWDRFVSVLGPPGPWELRTRQIDKNSLVIDFVYPACLKAAEHIGYIKPMVVLEPGTHAEFIPAAHTRSGHSQRNSSPLFNNPVAKSRRSQRSGRFGRRPPFACRVPSAGGQTNPSASFASLL